MDLSSVTPANTNEMPKPTGAPDAGVAPVVAPVVEPVVAPVTEPVVAPVVTSGDPVATPVEPVVAVEPVVESTPVEYVPTGNEFLDSAATVAIESGLNPVLLSQAIKADGDISAADRATLVESIGEAHTNMLVNGFKSEVKSAQAATDAADALVYSHVGGKDMWDSIAEWTRQPNCGLTDEGATEYNAMLKQGGIPAQLAANALKEAYMASPGFKEANATITEPTAMATPQHSVEPISRSVYLDETKKAQRTGDAATIASLEGRARHTMANAPQLWRPGTL